MFEKELEVATREENLCYFLLRGLRDTIQKKYNMIAIGDFDFIHSEDNKHQLQDFRKQLDDAEIKEFVITEKSSALMEILYALNSVGIEIVEPCTIVGVEECYWNDELKTFTKKGLAMRVVKL